MAVEAQALEHGFALVETPAAFIGAVDHDDVFGHGLRPIPILILRKSAVSDQRHRGSSERRL
jgi:hypothetical protein